LASSQVAKAPTDALHTLEQTTALIVTAIMNEQAASQSLGGPTILSLSATITISVNLPSRGITLSELQRLKRQFVTVHKKAITLGTIEKGDVDWVMEKIANKFTAYLEENLRL
jgi:protein KTI12